MAMKSEATDHDQHNEVPVPIEKEPTTDAEFARPSDDEVPILPVRAAETSKAAEGESTPILRELLGFHLYGRRPDSGQASSEPPSIPALLYRYGDLSRVRHDYPICLNELDPEKSVRPLSQIVDDLLSDVAGEGDAAEIMRRNIYRLESVMRSVTERESGQPLSLVWDRAATSLESTLKLTGEKKDQFENHLSTVRDALDIDGDLISCSAQTASQVFTTLMMSQWRERAETWREELTTLITSLNDILLADFERSDEAMSPEHLSDSLGTNKADLDTSALSAILSHRRHAEPLPDLRRKRIENALEILRMLQPVFERTAGEDATPPFKVDQVMRDCGSAVREHERRFGIMLAFFSAIRIARLETSNGYREAVHDPFFERFDRTCLTEEEFSLCPPVLAHLTSDALVDKEAQSLLDMLGRGLPVKILVTLDDVCGTRTDEPSVSAHWAARLSSVAMALNHVYVLQTPVSNFSALRAGFLNGLRYDGPALFSVFTGDRQTPRGFSTYLVAAAAAESRLFPIFEFNPANGESLAERMDVSGNPQSEVDWPEDSFRYRTDEDEEKTADLQFTIADFLFLDSRLGRHFWSVPPEKWHEDMVPFAEYIESGSEKASTKIPYLLVVDDMRMLTRVVVTRDVVSAALGGRTFWRNLQESGGINNSFANNIVAEEKERLEAEKKQEIDAIEQRYVAQLEQDIGELTREIIQRIASRLILDGESGTVMPTPATPPADAPAVVEPAAANGGEAEAVETAPAEDEDDEDDDIATLDDPYIDTPLCTTCNECTQLNAQMFAYNDNKQAFIKEATAGPFQDLVRAAELCPVKIIHPGKPKNPDEADLDEWQKRAAPFA